MLTRGIARRVGNYWSVDLGDFLAPNGAIGPKSGRALRLAQFFTEIVAQASNYDEPTTLRCRRRPGRMPCGGLLTLFFDVDNFDVLWSCPECDDNGRISGWKRTFWDNTELTETRS
jgi:hypothetical protein